ncbi:hypothetical protein [Ramlibacter montanisoli]|uniref:Uncharacterized protein n=1 Tax=Ramlibacter montanisoli TaxID=2732512 RepID=A0A849K1M3_9BURK|nr:hypothetical protein [Ramlibacter montanisoli]NNU42408.1 hypothetical protein [Ramlibacter montanisoli]
MMSSFLATHREELLDRCAQKVSERPMREATTVQVRNGIPLFLAQLQRTLEAEEQRKPLESLRISGPPGGDSCSSPRWG